MLTKKHRSIATRKSMCWWSIRETAGGVTALPLLGTSAGGVAFYSKQSGGILLIGDALLNLPGKAFRFSPSSIWKTGNWFSNPCGSCSI